MSLPLYIHGSTDVGRQRAQNEDSFRIATPPDGSRLLVVCDGMGGHEAGEVASQVASDRIVEVISASPPDNPPRAIYQAFVEANQSVVATSLTRGVEGMGTTGVICWVLEGRCYVGWVGDSRLYQFRAGTLIDRTRDHTRVAQMVSNGILTSEEARHHPDAHVLVMALGGSPGVQRSFKPEVWTEPLELKSGDVVLLCSDGLYDFIEDHELYPLIEGRDYQDAVTRLIQLANERGGADNITALLLVAGQPEVPRVAREPQERRRETLPDGLPLVSMEAPPTPVPVAATQAVPMPEPRRVEPVSPPVSQTVAPTGSSGRRVPLWWLLATGMLALGVGLALGLRAANGAASSPPAQAPVSPTAGGQSPPAGGK
jgi:protein phosphatase